MKKLFSIIVALIMALSVCSFAFAEDTTQTGTNAASLPPEIKAKVDTLKALEQTGTDIRQQIKGVNFGLKDLMQNFPKAEVARIKEAIGNVKNQFALNSQKMQELKAAVSDAIKNKDADKLKELWAQSADLRKQNEARNAQINSIKQQNAAQIQQIKDARQKIQAVKSKLDPFKDQVKPIKDQLKSLHQTMQGYSKDLKAAIDAKDYTKAGTILDNMISTKTQINAELSNLLALVNSAKSAMN